MKGRQLFVSSVALGVAQRIAFAGLVVVLCAPAQTRDRFEVASIKRSASADTLSGLQNLPGGHFIGTNVSVRLLIQRAYGVKDYQISGGPGWLGADRYDVEAKVDRADNISPERMQFLLQSLLAERFALKLHHRSMDVRGYALVVGKGGPKLTPSASPAGDPQNGMWVGIGTLTARGASLVTLANMLAGQVERPHY